MLFTYKENGLKNERPVDNANLETFTQTMPVAKYYRKTKTDNTCKTTEIIKNIDCNACKRNKSSTRISGNYSTSYKEYLKRKCKTYEQNMRNDSCCDASNNCFVYKRSNNKFNNNSAVDSSTRILRLKYDTIQTSGKYNIHRIKYRGDLTQNVLINDQFSSCKRRNGTKNVCG
jgi:hypothetical protein